MEHLARLDAFANEANARKLAREEEERRRRQEAIQALTDPFFADLAGKIRAGKSASFSVYYFTMKDPEKGLRRAAADEIKRQCSELGLVAKESSNYNVQGYGETTSTVLTVSPPTAVP